MTTSIQAIVFDFGGVLIEWDPRNLYRRYFPNQPQAMEQFLSEIHFSEWNARLDKGLPFKQGVAELSAQFPQHAQLIRAFHEQWTDATGGPIAGTIEILRKLKRAGWPVYGLSNWSSETFPITRTQYDFFDLLDGIVISGDVKLIKPDPAIFQTLLNKIGHKAEECVFIDDHLPNVKAAQALGFIAIQFQSPEQLERELHQLGIL